MLAPGFERVRHDFAFESNRELRVVLHDTAGHPLVRTLDREGSHLGQFMGSFACLDEPTIGVVARGAYFFLGASQGNKFDGRLPKPGELHEAPVYRLPL